LFVALSLVDADSYFYYLVESSNQTVFESSALYTAHQLPSLDSYIQVSSAQMTDGKLLAHTELPVVALSIPSEGFAQFLLTVDQIKAKLFFSRACAAGSRYEQRTIAVVEVSDLQLLDQINDEKGPIERQVLTLLPWEVAATPLQFSSVQNNDLEQIINSLSTTTYMTLLRGLSGEVPIVVDGVSRTTRTRNTYAQPHIWAGEWTAAYFRELGYAVTIQRFNVGSTPTFNVIATKTGTATPAQIFIMGAHYDSTSQTPATVAPGAVDNGSGSVAVMIAASAMARYRFRSTIQFVLFGGEEQGLVGSNFLVANRAGANIRSALIMDMIAYSNRFYGVIIEGTRNQAIMNLMDAYEAQLRIWSPRLTIRKDYSSFGSDHVPFQRAGIPAFLAIEQDDTNYPYFFILLT